MSDSIITAKFGGSSLADTSCIRHAVDIIKSNPSRKCIVVSAPGKRSSEDEKVTNLLLAAANAANENERAELFTPIKERFAEIIRELNLSLDIDSLIQQVLGEANNLASHPEVLKDFLASRGEWLNAQIVAAVSGFEFIDAAKFITFVHGKFSLEHSVRRAKHMNLSEIVSRGAVIPGYYGRRGSDGPIQTFDRGGSDITGAIVASLVGASVYENWTDTDGMLTSDPRIVPEARRIQSMSYEELRELSYMGASVFHPDAARFVWKAGIPTHIRNTDKPNEEGTLISVDHKPERRVTGIAAKNSFSIVTLKKYGVDDEIGALYRFTKIFSDHKVPVFHAPGSVDSMSVVVETMAFNKIWGQISDAVNKICKPDEIKVEHNVALICIVGVGMQKQPGTAAKVMVALAHAKVNILLINQGASEINIIIGIKAIDKKRALSFLHRELFEEFVPVHT